MKTEEIEVTIDKDGGVSIKVLGVKGHSCLELTRELERALGAQVESRQMTLEAYESPTEQIFVRQKT